MRVSKPSYKDGMLTITEPKSVVTLSKKAQPNTRRWWHFGLEDSPMQDQVRCLTSRGCSLFN